jgi:hypothetical protein
VEEIVRFVEHHAMRHAEPATKRGEPLQQRSHRQPLGVGREPRQIHDDAQRGLPQHGLEPGEEVLVPTRPMDDHAGEPVEAGVVALRIDDADGVPLQDQLLAQKPDEPRLAGPGIARDHGIAAAVLELDRLAVVPRAQHQPPARVREPTA